MNTRPAPPPEGALIAKAAARRGLSLRKAAEQAGISYGRWRQIATGYQNVSPGEFAIVRAPGGTLAKMARVVGVTPEQMAAAGRQDAAEAMQDTGQESPGQFQVISDPDGGLAVQQREAADKWAKMLTTPVGPELEEIKAAIDAAWPGATGTEVFPNLPALSEIWDMSATPRQYRIFAMAAWLHLQRNPEGLRANKAG